MRVFRVWPKRTKTANGVIITPSMVVTVTTQYQCTTPFSHGMNDVASAYMNLYRCDIKRLGCCSGDFNFQALA